MTGKDHLDQILSHSASHCGFWHGCPNPASIDNLYQVFDVKSDFELGLKLGSTCRWVMPDTYGMYTHPEGKPMFDVLGGMKRHSLGQGGVFADCEDIWNESNTIWAYSSLQSVYWKHYTTGWKYLVCFHQSWEDNVG